MTKSYQLGVDVGGTFTDLVAIDETGRTTIAKSPSIPTDQSVGVLNGLETLAERLGTDLRGLLSNTTRFVHGTTVATNALLERKGARVALLTTRGHRDVLEMREGMKEDRYNLRMAPELPLATRDLRFGVNERINSKGHVVEPLDLDQLAAIVEELKTRDVEAVAVCLLHAYRNDIHERQIEAYLEKEMPGIYISRSSEVLPQIKEYERFSTTAVNAYVGPAVKRYLTRLERRLKEAGFDGRLFIILSHGGMAPVEEAWRIAAATVLSGPAGGIAGARKCAELIGQLNLIPFDMGGTSTDISLIEDGAAVLSSVADLAGQRIALKSLDIASIASGGGSISRTGPGGQFFVGPESAGSYPGPICYGNGGDRVAVTDANLALGYLDADNFLGGKKTLDRPAMEAGVAELAGQLGIAPDDVAAGVYRLVNLQMADGIRIMTVRRGVDPRRYTMLSFGGAAGLHAAAVARELDIPRVVVPTVASVLSAWGMLASDLRYERSRSLLGEVKANAAEILEIYDDLIDSVRRRLSTWHDGDISIVVSAEMRYGEQIFEVHLPLEETDLRAPDFAERVIEKFHKRHEQLYTYAVRDQDVIFVNAHVAAVGSLAKPPENADAAQALAGQATPKSTRSAWFGKRLDAPVYDMTMLAPGQSVTGPAIIEAETTTVIVGDGDVATVNDFGWIDIAIAVSASA